MTVVFTEFLGGRVFELDETLDPSTLTELGGAALSGPSGAARDGAGAVVVAELTGDGISAADPGGAWNRLGSSGGGTGEFRRPVATAFASGRIVVLDGGNSRLVFIDDIGGGGWSTYGQPGAPTAADPAEGAYADPRGLAVDTSDRIWVTDPGNHRLTRIDGDLGGWTEIPLPGGAKPTVPYSVCAYLDGVALIDVGNRRLLIVDDAGTRAVALDRSAWPAPTFVTAVGDNLVVADLRANELRLLQPAGADFDEVARLRGSPPDVVVPLFDSIGGVGS
jgi:sugar lactone lactonase YvrE